MTHTAHIVRLPPAACLAPGVQAFASDAGHVKAFAERAITDIPAIGRDRVSADFSRPGGGFVDGEFYVFWRDASGVVVASGANTGIIGNNLSGVRLELNRMEPGDRAGWVNLPSPNPATNLIGGKVADLIRVDGHTAGGAGDHER